VEPEILMNITLRLPQRSMAQHIAPLMQEAIQAGGDTVHISLQPYDPEEDED
jgi:hypothetical protein